MRKIAIMTAASMLAIGQVGSAAAAPVKPVSGAVRAGTATANSSELGGRRLRSGTLFVSLAALSALILGIIAAASKDSRPASP